VSTSLASRLLEAAVDERQSCGALYEEAAHEIDGLQDQLIRAAKNVLALRAEVAENEGVIRVWRRRTETAEAEVERLRADAERYRWLRNEHDRYDPAMRCSAKYKLDRQSHEWVNVADLDSCIDAARASDPTIEDRK